MEDKSQATLWLGGRGGFSSGEEVAPTLSPERQPLIMEFLKNNQKCTAVAVPQAAPVWASQ
jgi:hypothetical protein